MAGEKIAQLSDRGIVSVSGADARKLLQGLITNDMARLTADGQAIHAALLTPQGKILFAFFVVQVPDGFLLETAAASAQDLAKRLSMYRLRADAAISDQSERYRVYALWDGAPPAAIPLAISFKDPRSADLGWRMIVKAEDIGNLAELDSEPATLADYAAHRIAFGIPEGRADYEFGDSYPHEAGFDLFDGVSFEKGCFVGQEVVARMQNKSVARKRVVNIIGNADLSTGSEITVGDVPIGKVGSTDGRKALAMLRLDRAQEAIEKNIPLTAGNTAVTVDENALRRYRKSISRST